MVALDVEQSAPMLRRRYEDDPPSNRLSSLPQPPPGLPPRHPLNILKRCSIIGGTIYALYDFNVFHNIMHNPKVSHEWFKVGLAASIAIVFLKGFVELYKGNKQGKKVEYENFKTATHCTILLILLSWISYHLALSPVYGTVKTWLIMIGFGWGVLIQCALFIPVSAQNIISVVFMTYFLHVYK